MPKRRWPRCHTNQNGLVRILAVQNLWMVDFVKPTPNKKQDAMRSTIGIPNPTNAMDARGARSGIGISQPILYVGSV